MFTHTKTEVDCSPGASTELSCQFKKEKKATNHAPGKRKEQRKQKKKKPNQTPPPATAEKNKIKQPHIRLALSRAGTLTAMDSAPKRKRSGITPATRAARQVTLTTWRVERLRLATLPSLSSAAALSMLAGTSLPTRLAAAPRMLSSLLKYAQAGTRPAPGGHTDLVKW